MSKSALMGIGLAVSAVVWGAVAVGVRARHENVQAAVDRIIADRVEGAQASYQKEVNNHIAVTSVHPEKYHEFRWVVPETRIQHRARVDAMAAKYRVKLSSDMDMLEAQLGVLDTERLTDEQFQTMLAVAYAVVEGVRRTGGGVNPERVGDIIRRLVGVSGMLKYDRELMVRVGMKAYEQEEPAHFVGAAAVYKQTGRVFARRYGSREGVIYAHVGGAGQPWPEKDAWDKAESALSEAVKTAVDGG